MAKDGMAETAEKTPVVTGPARELAAGAAYESEAAAAMATTLSKVNFIAAQGRELWVENRQMTSSAGAKNSPERAHHMHMDLQVGEE